MIDIRETEKEFLLFVPAPQKDRARAIAGYRWNPNRRCWVYPKTPRVYDALLAEFREDLPEITVSRPAPDLDDVLPAGGDHQRLAIEVQALREQLAAREREAQTLRKSLREAEERAAMPADDHQRFIAFFRSLALEAAGGDRAFKQLSAQLATPDAFPRVALAAVELLLRNHLGLAEHSTTRLADVIAIARATGALSQEAADLAALLATLGTDTTAPRNAGAIWARALLALYIAALLWPELSQE